ncbi:DNA-binding response regulator [Emticicia aquatilis]|uniref:DNA-binding response regulator n=1 Tax=Emticicia aquatilis TaxID=1537369 RepID=A0A916YUZ7_9BACT|nr:response regulator transcription factor [Emticicia aquatilis]GGD61771.1 DNA-binding response regulator [Emticicia aquatilis]
MIKLCLVDDHELLLKGLATIIDTQEDFSVIKTCLSGNELLDWLAQTTEIDALILDVNLPDFDAEELLIKIRKINPKVPILYLTILRGSRMFHKLRKHSFQGYLLKDTSYDILFDAIRTISSGGFYYSDDIDLNFSKDESIHESSYINKSSAVVLSNREKQILKLICEEYSSSQIAEKLFVSVSTVDTHRQNMMIKLGVSNTVGLVKYAFTYDLIPK